ncbi:hypothetical protein MHSWG343_01030 [Candidatus Mycoplasma haematohominis]|uniref:Uncharacterized protein n=1 Tax=Candidatus Mycoplasma haematohominis TaxID=1494318 RepID=A0A478FSS6_9MOLU|nr:hypothetical protein MHSWG343_01030 [Candidatus Mycoplasma haemohominis]
MIEDGFEFALKLLGVATASMGASCILIAMVPTFIATYKTKNTVGLNKTMFLLHTCVAILFAIGAYFLTAKGCILRGNLTNLIFLGVIFSVLNTVCGLGNLYVLTLKNKNMAEAKKMGISESEYHDRMYANK